MSIRWLSFITVALIASSVVALVTERNAVLPLAGAVVATLSLVVTFVRRDLNRDAEARAISNEGDPAASDWGQPGGRRQPLMPLAIGAVACLMGANLIGTLFQDNAAGSAVAIILGVSALVLGALAAFAAAKQAGDNAEREWTARKR